MKKHSILSFCLVLLSFSGIAQNDSLVLLAKLDSINKSFTFQTGTIKLGDNLAQIIVPQGFKFLDASQSERVLVDLWGNPKESAEGTLGMIFPETAMPMNAESWAFHVSYEESGFVKDEDADEINYDDLLKDMQKDTETASEERVKQGYEAIQLVGWAAPPFYDKSTKVLHWAKEIKFGDATENTLNYNIRVLGRKGILVINAIGAMSQYAIIQPHIPAMTSMVTFEEGNKYSDFNPDVDKVAAYGIGGLIAGKILSKVGFFAILAKFWKVILAAIVGGGGFIWRFITGKKEEKDVEEEGNQEKPKDDTTTNV